MRWSIISPLKIAMLDDHALIREALKIRLSMEADFKVTSVYTTSRDLLEGLHQHMPDLLILDYQLADGEVDGLRLIQSVRARHPELKIVIYSSVEGPATVNLCIRAGVNGFVGKTQQTEHLLKAVRMAAMDRIYLAPIMSTELEKQPSQHASEEHFDSGDTTLMDFPELSPKEREVLRCCLEGLSVTQVATKFSRSRKTISGQKQSAFRKLGIRTDIELFKIQHKLKES